VFVTLNKQLLTYLLTSYVTSVATGLQKHYDRSLYTVSITTACTVATTVHQCQHGMAPAYLTELCSPIAATASRRGGLRSATTSNLVIPRCRLSTYGTVLSVSLVQSAGMPYPTIYSHQTFLLIVLDTS